jgi:hypothetical protein
VSTLTKDTKRAKRHIDRGDGRALCGGGNSGRTAPLQQDFAGDPNCDQCLAIDYRRRNTPPKPVNKQPTKEPNEEGKQGAGNRDQK